MRYTYDVTEWIGEIVIASQDINIYSENQAQRIARIRTGEIVFIVYATLVGREHKHVSVSLLRGGELLKLRTSYNLNFWFKRMSAHE